ncbi:hypothetical protein ASZ90_019383 [hydrocarbon metagenome]|uniref:Nickel insertion protein n=1 Tax=hydrocarbon metagenome TaxID=938273 RepID=A0A0W8E3T4_9ZZZZ
MDKVLYFDCFAGISGDMIVGALLDLGAREEYLYQQLSELKLPGYRLRIEKSHKLGIWGIDFGVVLEESESHHGHHHSHRGLSDITSIISESTLSENVKIRALEVFKHLAGAEAHIHGITLDEVHFHEVGAVDSIVDVIAALICMEDLNINKVYSSPLHLGEGFVHCAHGLLPVPAPAVLEITKGIPVYTTGLRSELVTPTGAALISNLAEYFGPFPEMIVEAVGYGLGDRDLEIPNLLRVIKARQNSLERIWTLECNIDDMNPQLYSYLFPLLMERGALDVYLTPLIMKKNRPGNCLTILCEAGFIDELEETLWRETTTLGVRRLQVQRRILERKLVSVPTLWGPVTIKIAFHNGKLLKFAPEYEDLSRIAREAGLPLQYLQTKVQITAAKWLEEQGWLDYEHGRS